MGRCTKTSGQYDKQHIRQNRRKKIHTTHRRRRVSHRLEVNRQEERRHQQTARKARIIDTAGPDHTAPYQCEWNHRLVTFVVFPPYEGEQRSTSTAKQSDYIGTLPAVGGAAPVQSQ